MGLNLDYVVSLAIQGEKPADGIDDVGNGAIMHGINEFEGHLGKQEGHITDTSVSRL